VSFEWNDSIMRLNSWNVIVFDLVLSTLLMISCMSFTTEGGAPWWSSPCVSAVQPAGTSRGDEQGRRAAEMKMKETDEAGEKRGRGTSAVK
jgi:hypothetical protein